MPAKLIDGRSSKAIARRHGKTGYLPLNVTISRDMKESLVRRARKNRTSLNEEVRVAIERYLG